MSKKFLFALLLLLPTVTLAQNNTDNTSGTGDELVEGCKAFVSDYAKDTITFEAGTCYGYLAAYSRIAAFYKVIFPSNVTYRQQALVIVKYGAEHPEKLHQIAITFYAEAMNHAWPSDKH